VYGEYQTASMTIFNYVDDTYDTGCSLKIVASKSRKIVGDFNNKWGELKFRFEILNNGLGKDHPARYKKFGLTKTEFAELMDSIREATSNSNRYIDNSTIKRRAYDTDLVMGFRVSKKTGANNILISIMNSHTDYSFCPIPAMVFETYFRRQLESMIITMINFESLFDNSRIMLENQEFMKIQIQQSQSIIAGINQAIEKFGGNTILGTVENRPDNSDLPLPEIKPNINDNYSESDIVEVLKLNDDHSEIIDQNDDTCNTSEKLKDAWIGIDEVCPVDEVQETKNLLNDFENNLGANLDSIELDVNPKRLDVEALPTTTIQRGKIHSRFKKDGVGIELFENMISDFRGDKTVEILKGAHDVMKSIIGCETLPGIIEEDFICLYYMCTLAWQKERVGNIKNGYMDRHIVNHYTINTTAPTSSLIDSAYEFIAIVAYLQTLINFDRQQNAGKDVNRKIVVLNFIYDIFSPLFYSVLAYSGINNFNIVVGVIKTKLKSFIEDGYFKKYDEYLKENSMAKININNCDKHITEVLNDITTINLQNKIDICHKSNMLFADKQIVLPYDNNLNLEQIYKIIKFEAENLPSNQHMDFKQFVGICHNFKITKEDEAFDFLRTTYTSMGNVDLSILDGPIVEPPNITNPQTLPPPTNFNNDQKITTKKSISGPYRYLKAYSKDNKNMEAIANENMLRPFMDWLQQFDVTKDFDVKTFPFNISEFPRITLSALMCWTPETNLRNNITKNYIQYKYDVENNPHTWQDIINMLNEKNEELLEVKTQNWFESI